MIVRINQLETSSAETTAGWPDGSLCGAIERAWPDSVFAYQVTVLDRDEQHQPVNAGIRRDHVSAMLPKVIDALTGPDDRIVLRFDGPMTTDGLAPLFGLAARTDKVARFSYPAADKLSDRSEPPVTSIRIFPVAGQVNAICSDPGLFGPAVRLRVFALPDGMVDPMLDTYELDDERWRDLMSHLSFCLSSSSDGLSIVVWSASFEPATLRRVITDRLGGRETGNGSLAAAKVQ